jgi:dolichol-phosphate mannosyltransferase
MPEQRPNVVVMIPTYNEKDSIGGLIREILGLPLECDLSVLVVDDDSPDGTAEEVALLRQHDPRVHLLLRKIQRGRGLAGIEGFKQALSQGADLVIEMDGDGSHQPHFIPALLEKAREEDLVIGSRFVQGGKDADRPVQRRLITFFVRHFIRRLFCLPVRDVSSGFRCFRREVLEKIDLDSLLSSGPSVVLETLYKVHLMGFKIGEVPIVFVDRKKGQTKLSARILVQTLSLALKFGRTMKRPVPR